MTTGESQGPSWACLGFWGRFTLLFSCICVIWKVHSVCQEWRMTIFLLLILKPWESYCCFIFQKPEKLSVSQSGYKTRDTHRTENEFWLYTQSNVMTRGWWLFSICYGIKKDHPQQWTDEQDDSKKNWHCLRPKWWNVLQ